MPTYHEDLTQRFVENFSQDIVCHFTDGYYNGSTDLGSSYLNMSTFDQVSDQPTSEYFMSISVSEGATLNASITDGSIKHKSVLAFVDFSIFWPVEKSKKHLMRI